ncbi:MAG: PilT/PilU family type 4a pilus ATPase [Lachnospiraceae bacterium]|nr:PilT/PilU family type 4a pilus ATPase [Lachnospiraceae bacterium]
MTFDELLNYAIVNECSDIHITVGTHLAVRRFGTLQIINPEPTMAEARALIEELMTPEQIALADSGKDLDFARFCQDGKVRIRVNIYHQRNNLAASIRLLNEDIPDFHTLQLPEVIESFCQLPRGLVLITGPTGSGKTTTLASMIDYINKSRPCHIMTVEDPIEYIYNHKLAMIHQRELGKDVSDYATALRSSLREDPDIILVGEMRDYETIRAAITAAETGHLVFSTLHTTSAAQTIDRIIDGCPLEGRDQLRIQLSTILYGVVSQQLLPLQDGTGRVVATETMVMNPAIANLIRENKTNQIQSTIQSNASMGMHTLNTDLKRLISSGQVDRLTASRFTNDRDGLIRMLDGV